ncbi:hypothetical protein A3F65_00090 [Candidatus Saccharibacteria bacterium RIFCSPHIGHO2_12_FULL_47_16b]|nr:MAG: hypothetical protein A3F65_00090 [Candidatus Saccharibacteria bacterium RIFCSPHIGHO2_12_FULL_47_16b]
MISPQEFSPPGGEREERHRQINDLSGSLGSLQLSGVELPYPNGYEPNSTRVYGLKKAKIGDALGPFAKEADFQAYKPKAEEPNNEI